LSSIVLKGFAGLQNQNAPERFAQEDLQEALNVDIDNSGAVRRRQGYKQLTGLGGSYHSIWSDGIDYCLYMDGTSLMRLHDDNTTEVIRTGIVSGNPMAYLYLNGRVYYTDGVITGVVDNGISRSWGLSIPSLPILSATGGGLITGMYRVGLTYQRLDGQESGASVFASIHLSDNQGITINYVASPDPGVAFIRIYVTHRNGTQMYLLTTIGNATGSVTYDGQTPLSVTLLTTQGLYPVVAGEMLDFFMGRIFVSNAEVLHWTQPLAYELYDPMRNWIQFDSMINTVGVVVDGIYVGTATEIMFLSYDQSGNFTTRPVAAYGSIFNAVTTVDASLLLDGSMTGIACLMGTQQGLCVGYAGGQFNNLTHERFMMDYGNSGVAAVIARDGMNQFLVLYPNPDIEAENEYEINSYAELTLPMIFIFETDSTAGVTIPVPTIQGG